MVIYLRIVFYPGTSVPGTDRTYGTWYLPDKFAICTEGRSSGIIVRYYTLLHIPLIILCSRERTVYLL